LIKTSSKRDRYKWSIERGRTARSATRLRSTRINCDAR